MNINELKQDRHSKRQAASDIVEMASKENRLITEEEQKRFNQLENEVLEIVKKIEQEEKAEQLRKEIASEKIDKRGAKEVKTEEEKVKAKYSFLNAVRSQLPNQKLEGVEREMHEEAVKEARESGINLQGVGVPSFFMDTKKEKRDLDVTNVTAGGHLVQTSVGGLIPALRPRLQTQAMGAQVLSGLVGNLDLPRHNGVTTGTWEGEDDANAESTPTFDKISLSPNRVGAYTEITKQLLAQSQNESVEALVRNDLNMAIRIAVDSAAINGAGSGNVPEGILNVTGIGDVAGGTNGAVPTFANIVELETAVAVDNADMGALGYLTTPGIRGVLKVTEKASNTAQFVWTGGQAGELNGYRAMTSTQVPSDLVKGSSSDSHAIIFGNWNELIIANWAGVDLIVDPYTLAKNAKIQLVINSWWDIAVRHAESFAAMQDANLS